jgi:hypothetical protein
LVGGTRNLREVNIWTRNWIAEALPSDLRPTDASYWEKRGDNTVGIGHVFKCPYACYDLLRRADDPELRRAWNEKAYHLF